MTKRLASPLIIALAFICTSTLAAAQQSDRAVGIWAGPLNVGAMSLRLELTIARDANGALTGVMKSIDQGGAEMAGTLSVRGDSVSFTMPGPHASYAGVIDAGGDSIRGTFVQGQSFPLTLVRAAHAATRGRPQDPKPPFPYRTKDISFESAPGVRLAGTIDIPAGQGPFPAVVFVTGSGPQNRDEEVMDHRPFLVIADYLARHGIASLRYDDRGTAQSTGNFAGATTADFADDAEAAVRVLKSQPSIASTIGILGHSEGGLIAPMVAARSRDVGFIVMLAGPGIPDDSVLFLQNIAVSVASGVPPDVAARNAETSRRLFVAVRDSKDSADAAARLAVAKQEALAGLPEDRRAAAGAQLDKSIPQLLSPWMRFFLKYDTRTALRNVHVPVLALGGSLDTQVPAREDLAGIDTTLQRAGNRDYRVVELPGLNHLFQPAKTGGPAEYATIETTVDPQVLDLVATWISQHAKAR